MQTGKFNNIRGLCVLFLHEPICFSNKSKLSEPSYLGTRLKENRRDYKEYCFKFCVPECKAYIPMVKNSPLPQKARPP